MDLSNKLFLRFVEENVLPGSSYSSMKDFRIAAKQRERALVYWHSFVGYRQHVGLCISCNRRHLPTQQRCAVHRNINRVRCRNWARKNRKNIRAKEAEIKVAGLCVNNPKHGKAWNGHIKCKECFNRTKAQRASKNAAQGHS